jgi:hypothetical protein
MRAMNLLPVEERGGARPAGAPGRLTAVHGIAGAGALVTVGLLASFAMAKQETSTARDATAAAITRSATAQAQVDRLAPVVAFDARRQARESAVLQLATGRTDWASVLQATAGSLPSSVKLSTIKLAAADAAGATATAGTTGAAPAGLGGSGTVTLSICADSQPRVATTLRRLRALPQVEDVALGQTAVAATDGTSGTSTVCTEVAADAALGLSASTALDGAPAAAATTPGAATTTPGAATPAPTTTGASR